MTKNICYRLMLVLVTVALFIVLPRVADEITERAHKNTLLAYSHLMGEIGIINYSDPSFPLKDRQGNSYSVSELDSLFPLMHFRQLMAEGRMPDSIGGYEANLRTIMSRTVNCRHLPTERAEPSCHLHLMYESMPKRVGLVLPDDVVSFGSRVVFTDANTLQENVQKGEAFTSAMQKAGFAFPCLASWGNDNLRKKYDEGFFCLDSDSALFHVKMVNGRPFVRGVPMPEGLRPKLVWTYEPQDRSFYGFLFGANNEVAIVEAMDEVGYNVRQFSDIEADIAKDGVYFSANLLHWNVTLKTAETQRCWSYERESMQLVDTLSISLAEENLPQEIARALFAFQIVGKPNGMGETSLGIAAGPTVAWLINIIFATVYYLVRGRKTNRRGLMRSIYIAATGLCGILALLFVPKSRM